MAKFIIFVLKIQETSLIEIMGSSTTIFAEKHICTIKNQKLIHSSLFELKLRHSLTQLV